MQNLKTLHIQVLIDMLVKQTTQYTAKLSNKNGKALQQDEHEISILVEEIKMRTPATNFA